MYLPLFWILSSATLSDIVPMAVVMIPLYPGFGMANELPEEVAPPIRLAINVWVGGAVIVGSLFTGRRGINWLLVTCVILALISYANYKVFPRANRTNNVRSITDQPSLVLSNVLIRDVSETHRLHIQVIGEIREHLLSQRSGQRIENGIDHRHSFRESSIP